MPESLGQKLSRDLGCLVGLGMKFLFGCSCINTSQLFNVLLKNPCTVLHYQQADFQYLNQPSLIPS